PRPLSEARVSPLDAQSLASSRLHVRALRTGRRRSAASEAGGGRRTEVPEPRALVRLLRRSRAPGRPDRGGVSSRVAGAQARTPDRTAGVGGVGAAPARARHGRAAVGGRRSLL